MLAAFALLSYVVVIATPGSLWKPEGPWWRSIAVWFAAAIIAHDLVLFPIYALADRLLGMSPRRRARCRELRVPVRNYIRVPVLGSGLLLLMFFPSIFNQNAQLFSDDTGLTQHPFLGRWLLLTAAMFGASALAYGTRLAMTRLRAMK